MTRRWALVGANVLVALVALTASLGWLVFLGQIGWSGLAGILGIAAAVNVLGTAIFALSAVAHLRRWRLRWIVQAAAVVALVGGPLGVQAALLRPASETPMSRTTTSAQGIDATFDLEFSGAFTGRFTDPEFLSVIQHCGRDPDITPTELAVDLIIGRVATERVALSLSIAFYTGPGSYALTPYGTTPPVGQPRTLLVVERISGQLTDNAGDQWDGMAGTVTVNPDERSGSLDAELRSHRAPQTTALRVRGTWSCSAARYVPSR